MNTEQAIEEQLRKAANAASSRLSLADSRYGRSQWDSLSNRPEAAVCPKGTELQGRSPWFIDRGSISAIEIARRTWQPYNGGLRRRLLIRCTDGSEQFFVLNHVDAVAADFRARLSL